MGERAVPARQRGRGQAAAADPVSSVGGGLRGRLPVALPAAAAIELVHNFSLIHDDIEDRSSERRHRPTVWRLWGEPHAINAGDGLLMVARLALGGLVDRRHPAERPC